MDLKTAITEVAWPVYERPRQPDAPYRTLFRWQATLADIADDIEILDVDVRWTFKGQGTRLDAKVSRAVVPPVRPIRYAPMASGVIFVHAWSRSDIEGTWCANDAPMLVPAGPVCITEMRPNPAGRACHCGVFALRHPEGPPQKT